MPFTRGSTEQSSGVRPRLSTIFRSAPRASKEETCMWQNTPSKYLPSKTDITCEIPRYSLKANKNNLCTNLGRKENMPQNCEGVRKSFSSVRSRTVSGWPLPAAMCNGVLARDPPGSFKLSGRRATMRSATVLHPLAHATCIQVYPLELRFARSRTLEWSSRSARARGTCNDAQINRTIKSRGKSSNIFELSTTLHHMRLL